MSMMTNIISGFRIMNDLLVGVDNGSVNILILSDLSAAFDTVDHRIMLYTLENFLGIKRQAL